MPRCDGTGSRRRGMKRSMCAGYRRSRCCMWRCGGFVERDCCPPCFRERATLAETIVMLEGYKKKIEKEISFLKKECEEQDG